MRFSFRPPDDPSCVTSLVFDHRRTVLPGRQPQLSGQNALRAEVGAAPTHPLELAPVLPDRPPPIGDDNHPPATASTVMWGATNAFASLAAVKRPSSWHGLTPGVDAASVERLSPCFRDGSGQRDPPTGTSPCSGSQFVCNNQPPAEPRQYRTMGTLQPRWGGDCNAMQTSSQVMIQTGTAYCTNCRTTSWFPRWFQLFTNASRRATPRLALPERRMGTHGLHGPTAASPVTAVPPGGLSSNTWTANARRCSGWADRNSEMATSARSIQSRT